jgi:nitroimidazol reductase NimA-like FMN-containing flavoprotein (pyridoxamine 5'-phosphate oxidase superfamily)
MPGQKMESEGIVALLESQAVGRLAVDNNGRPYVVPLHYLYEDGKIYFHSKKDGLKISCLLANPQVCLEVDEVISISSGKIACNFTTKYRSALAFGTARIMEESTEKAAVTNRLVEKYAQGNNFETPSEKALANVAIVEICVTEMTGKSRV